MRQMIAILFFIAAIIGAPLVAYMRYSECRAHGFSVLYCWGR